MKKKTHHLKIKLIYALAFGTCLALFIIMSVSSPSPNITILGKWQEVSWEYEKLPDTHTAALGKHINNTLRNEITRELVIHQAETWEFLPDGKLLLHTDEKSVPLQWTLKSRGNILKLDHRETSPEHYNLQALNENEMVLYFNTDLQAKGIAKMKFKKIHQKDYAQKIQ